VSNKPKSETYSQIVHETNVWIYFDFSMIEIQSTTDFQQSDKPLNEFISKQ
jgi:hypothetical protein